METFLPTASSEASPNIRECKFIDPAYLEKLPFRDAPYWHTLSTSRHIGVYRPNDRICTWTARYLTKEKKYKQRRIGRALNSKSGMAMPLGEAVRRSVEWFASPEVKRLGNETKSIGKTDRINCTPIGDVYTVGHALHDYTEWTRISRSPGGHYNNLVLINYHIVPNFAQIPLDQFKAAHLAQLARQVIQTPPRSGFEPPSSKHCALEDLCPDELRRRKRTFNSLVSILRMAFRHAWENRGGRGNSDH